VETTLINQPEIAQAYVYVDGGTTLRALLVSRAKPEKIDDAVERANRLLPNYAHIHTYEQVMPFTRENGQLTGNGKLRRQAIANTYTNRPFTPVGDATVPFNT